jgi:hypothetical protein
MYRVLAGQGNLPRSENGHSGSITSVSWSMSVPSNGKNVILYGQYVLNPDDIH